MIALVMPITPSRTGSKWNPASLFWPEPTYLHAVLVWFVATNLLLVIIGVVAWIALRLRPSRD